MTESYSDAIHPERREYQEPCEEEPKKKKEMEIVAQAVEQSLALQILAWM